MMQITSKTPTTTIINNVVNFGNIKLMSELKQDLYFSGDINNLVVSPTCFCTALETEKIAEGEYKITLKYKNTNILGTFTKTVKVNYTTRDRNKINTIFKITGTIIK